MKNIKLLLAIATSAALLTGCQNTRGINTDLAISSGLNAYKAATLSDADAKAVANQDCVEADNDNKVTDKSSKYGKRLAKITKALDNNINDTPVNYKVYMTSDVNAWAIANGRVRVYSGLMNMMNDNRIEGISGHELGRVASDYSLVEIKAFYAIAAACDAISITSGMVSQLSRSQLGDITEGATNAKHSYDKESEVDGFSFNLLKERGTSTQGLAGSFEKLAGLDGGRAWSMFDSHPSSTERTQHIRDHIASGKQITVIFWAGLPPARYNCAINPHLNIDKIGSYAQHQQFVALARVICAVMLMARPF